MEHTRRNLKNYSVIVLGLAALSLINIIFETFFGELNSALNSAVIPEGAPENVVMIAKMVVLAVSVLMLLPHAYIGIKGIKIANDPDDSAGHIVWGIILIVFTAIELISPLLALLRGEGVALGNASEFLSIAVDVFVLVEYVKFAREVRDEI